MTNLPKMQLVPLSLPTGPIFAIKSLERVRNAASSFSLPTDPILAIKSLECSDLSEIQPTWRSRAWNVLISPKRSFFTLSSNRSNSCDHELGMCDLSEMQLQ
jgi:hypothetical protein